MKQDWIKTGEHIKAEENWNHLSDMPGAYFYWNSSSSSDIISLSLLLPFFSTISLHLKLEFQFSSFHLISLLIFDYVTGINYNTLQHTASHFTTPCFIFGMVTMWLSHKPFLPLLHHLKKQFIRFFSFKL